MVTTVLDIFFINPNTKPLFTFLPSPHGTRRRIQAWGPTTGAIPRRQAEALHRRALAGHEAHLGANHPETLKSMNNLAVLLRKQGKLDEAGMRSSGWEVTFLDVSPRAYFVWPRPEARIFVLFPGIVGRFLREPMHIYLFT